MAALFWADNKRLGTQHFTFGTATFGTITTAFRNPALTAKF